MRREVLRFAKDTESNSLRLWQERGFCSPKGLRRAVVLIRAMETSRISFIIISLLGLQHSNLCHEPLFPLPK